MQSVKPQFKSQKRKFSREKVQKPQKKSVQRIADTEQVVGDWLLVVGFNHQQPTTESFTSLISSRPGFPPEAPYFENKCDTSQSPGRSHGAGRKDGIGFDAAPRIYGLFAFSPSRRKLPLNPPEMSHG